MPTETKTPANDEAGMARYRTASEKQRAKRRARIKFPPAHSSLASARKRSRGQSEAKRSWAKNVYPDRRSSTGVQTLALTKCCRGRSVVILNRGADALWWKPYAGELRR